MRGLLEKSMKDILAIRQSMSWLRYLKEFSNFNFLEFPTHRSEFIVDALSFFRKWLQTIGFRMPTSPMKKAAKLFWMFLQGAAERAAEAKAPFRAVIQNESYVFELLNPAYP